MMNSNKVAPNDTDSNNTTNNLNGAVTANQLMTRPLSPTEVWTHGPDEIMPAKDYFSSRLDEPVKLRIKDTNSTEYKPLSVYTIFEQTVNKRPNHPALCYKQQDKWLKFTYKEYFEICRKAAKSFIKIGLEPSNVVCIIGFNTPQWFISCVGCIFAAGVCCGVYTTNSVEACEYTLNDCKSRIVVVENKQQLDKILKCREDGIPIDKIILFTSDPVENDHDGLVINWTKFIDLGKDLDEMSLTSRIRSLAPNKCATLIYTSGTTGNPKAAMISHDSISYQIQHVACTLVDLQEFNERFITYLPLSHIAAQIVDLYTPLMLGITVYFAQPDALKGSLQKTLQEVRPTYFFGVPRVYEKMQEKIQVVISGLTGKKKSLFDWATKITSERIKSMFKGEDITSFSHVLAKTLVLNNVHKTLGLDKCRKLYSGAAPITKETLELFISLGFPICEVYGMSETTGPHSVGTNFNNRVTSVGAVDRYNRAKLSSKDPDGSGELCIFGRHIFMGYLNDMKKTKESLDEDGWLKTGDLAKIDDGYLYITGRLKELIITAGGENIAPVPIEDNVKAELSQLISNCMLIGDRRKYLVMLVTLKCKIDLDTMLPTDDLTDEAVKYLATKGCSNVRTVRAAIENAANKASSVVHKEIENAITRANAKSTSRAAKVQKFTILPRDFSLPNGELGPTLKLRRPMVLKIYSKEIEELYVDKNGSAGAD